jgi:hypothetical protein
MSVSVCVRVCPCVPVCVFACSLHAVNVTGLPLNTESRNVNGLEGQDPTAYRYTLRPAAYGVVRARVNAQVQVWVALRLPKEFLCAIQS